MANIAGQALSTYSPELDQLDLCGARNLGSSNITKLAECCPELRLVNLVVQNRDYKMNQYSEGV